MDGIERQTAGLTVADDKLCHWLQWWQAAVHGKAVSSHPTLTSVPVGDTLALCGYLVSINLTPFAFNIQRRSLPETIISLVVVR